MSEMANPCEEWVLKSQTAVLVAEVFECFFLPILKLRYSFFADTVSNYSTFNVQIVRREGVDLWTKLLPTLVSLSNQGPVQVNNINFFLLMFSWSSFSMYV